MELKTTVIKLVDYLIITMFGLCQFILLIFAINYFTEILGQNHRLTGDILGALSFAGCNLFLLFLTKANLLLDKK